jgi:hypothetical protein
MTCACGQLGAAIAGSDSKDLLTLDTSLQLDMWQDGRDAREHGMQGAVPHVTVSSEDKAKFAGPSASKGSTTGWLWCTTVVLQDMC